MKEWTSLIRPEDKEVMDRANARVDEFIRFRTELVRISREVNLVEFAQLGRQRRQSQQPHRAQQGDLHARHVERQLHA